MNKTASPFEENIAADNGSSTNAPLSKTQLSTESILQALVENSFDFAGLIDENLNYRYVSESFNGIFNSKADALFGFAEPDAGNPLGEWIGSSPEALLQYSQQQLATCDVRLHRFYWPVPRQRLSFRFTALHRS